MGCINGEFDECSPDCYHQMRWRNVCLRSFQNGRHSWDYCMLAFRLRSSDEQIVIRCLKSRIRYHARSEKVRRTTAADLTTRAFVPDARKKQASSYKLKQ